MPRNIQPTKTKSWRKSKYEQSGKEAESVVKNSLTKKSIGPVVTGEFYQIVKEVLWITINCGKFWKRWEYQTTWPASWEICMQGKKQQLELDMEQQTGSK